MLINKVEHKQSVASKISRRIPFFSAQKTGAHPFGMRPCFFYKGPALPSATNQNLPDGRWVPCARFLAPFVRLGPRMHGAGGLQSAGQPPGSLNLISRIISSRNKSNKAGMPRFYCSMSKNSCRRFSNILLTL